MLIPRSAPDDIVWGEVRAAHDRLYQRALMLAADGRTRMSTSAFQRELTIGYYQAARLIQALQDEGVISAPDCLGRRHVLAGRA